MYKWRKNNGIAQSHTLMDGGLFFVPIGKSDDFYADYIEYIKHAKLFVTELKTPQFKFFVDIDHVADAPLTKDEVIEIARQVHQVVPGRCIVAYAPPKKCRTAIKSGIHMHWPDLIVDVTGAQVLAQNIHVPHLDASVYKGSGIRMLWSHKKGINGDEDPYIPLIELPDTLLDPTPSVDMLRLCSIRTGDDVPLTKKRSASSELETFVQRCMCDEMRFRGLPVPNDYHVDIKRISRVKKTIVIQTSSKMCIHKRAEHSSNHVYFVVDATRFIMHQRCHDEGCSSFKGMNHTIPKTLINELKEYSVDT